MIIVCVNTRRADHYCLSSTAHQIMLRFLISHQGQTHHQLQTSTIYFPGDERMLFQSQWERSHTERQLHKHTHKHTHTQCFCPWSVTWMTQVGFEDTSPVPGQTTRESDLPLTLISFKATMCVFVCVFSRVIRLCVQKDMSSRGVRGAELMTAFIISGEVERKGRM